MLNTNPPHRSNKVTTVIEEEEIYAKSATGNHEKAEFARVLRVIWDHNLDKFMLDLSELIKFARLLTPSKQSLLWVTAKIFDPLGFLAPFVICLKILFQLLYTNQYKINMLGMNRYMQN